MKTALLYGEFKPTSSTGIAYMNSHLEKSLIKTGYRVTKIIEPRSNDYNNYKTKIKKNINLFAFIKIFLLLISYENKDISFITISMGNLGLIKTFVIQSLLIRKSKRNYIYIHRGDLEDNYNKSLYKKILINLILKNAFKIIFLSEIFRRNNRIKSLNNKILIIPNALSRFDYKISRELFKTRNNKKNNNIKTINFLFCGNLQKEKGIFKVISAIKIINKNNINKCKIKLDIYGLKFENIKFKDEFIQYKGRLENNERLKTMSKYDCLILPSLTEGLPMTLIESLSIGLPFITTKVGAIEDLLIQNYPYICNFNIDSIKNKINSFINDFTNNKTLVNELISKNNELFLKKFKYTIFEKNIKKFIY